MTYKKEVPSSPPPDANIDQKMQWANDYWNQERQKEAEEILLTGSKEVLLKAVDKKVMTTAVGALDKFEQAFGYLWGREKSSLQRNDKERAVYSAWRAVRRDILDSGERQKTQIRKELNNYKILFKGFENDSTQRSG
jgi:transcription termination factor Rho